MARHHDNDPPNRIDNSRARRWLLWWSPSRLYLGRGLRFHSHNNPHRPVSREIAMQSTTEPSTPNPQVQVLIFTLIRAVMQILGAFGITWAMTVSAATWEIVAGALAILISTLWSL